MCGQNAELLVLKYQAVSIITTGFRSSVAEKNVPVYHMFRINKVSVKRSVDVFRSYEYDVRFTQVKS